jgi:hypothetical protein
VVTKSGMSTSVPNRTRGGSNHGRRCTVTSRPCARHPWPARHRWPRGTAARRGREEVLRVWHGMAKVVVRLIGTGREHHNSWGGKLYRAAMAELGDGALRRPRSMARVGELTSPRVNGVVAACCKEGAWARQCLQQQWRSCTGAGHGGIRARRSR